MSLECYHNQFALCHRFEFRETTVINLYPKWNQEKDLVKLLEFRARERKIYVFLKLLTKPNDRTGLAILSNHNPYQTWNKIVEDLCFVVVPLDGKPSKKWVRRNVGDSFFWSVSLQILTLFMNSLLSRRGCHDCIPVRERYCSLLNSISAILSSSPWMHRELIGRKIRTSEFSIPYLYWRAIHYWLAE